MRLPFAKARKFDASSLSRARWRNTKLALLRLEDRCQPSGSAPTVLISGAPQTPEGQSYLLNLTVKDPENDPVSGWTINWGDGNVQSISGNPSTIRHTYAAGPNTYAVTASAIVGGESFAAKVADAGRYLGQFVAPGNGLDGPRWMTFGPDGNLYVVNIEHGPAYDGADILRYDGTTGAYLGVFIPKGSGGMVSPHGIAFGPDGNVYVGSYAQDCVRRYDGTTGAFIDVFVPPGSGGLDEPMGLTFGPDADLYVAEYGSAVRRYSGASGAYRGSFTAHNEDGDAGTAIFTGPDGRLYYNNAGAGFVRRFDAAAGTLVDEFIPPFYGNTNRPYGMTFGPDGDFYLCSSNAGSTYAGFNRVVRFDGITGEMIDVYAAGPEQDGLFAGTFGPDGSLYVSSMYNNTILRYSGPLSAGTATQVSVRVLDVSTYSNSTRQNISNSKVVRSTINVTDTFNVADVNVTVNIDHTRTADLRVYLISPAGSRVQLFTYVGGNGRNFTNTTIDDEATRAVTRGVAPFTGSYFPQGRGAERLSLFDGQAARGTWTLEITDIFAALNGKLNSWQLTLARAAAPLLAAGGPAPVPTVAPAFSATDVKPLLTEALQRWTMTGSTVLAPEKIDVRIADLGGATLGIADGNTIYLDDNAAGWGWFIDPTPWDDSEFTAPGDQGEQGRMDLLTVLMHELGHVMGHEHEDDGVMAETLSSGTRLNLHGVDVQASWWLSGLPVDTKKRDPFGWWL